MAKPYDFESPLATENTIRKVADIIKTNFATKESVQNTIGSVDIQNLEKRVTSIETDLDGLLEVMKQVVM